MAEKSSVILQAACDRDDRNRGQRVRLLASAGIAVQATHKGVVGKPEEDEQLSLADQRFTVAPGSFKVLTLVGNLHLSLCDWAPGETHLDSRGLFETVNGGTSTLRT